MGEDQRLVPDPGGIDHEPVFAVVMPTGWQRPPGLQPAPPTAGLSGRRVGFVWDQLFNGDLVFDAIADELSRSFAGMEFVGHAELRRHPWRRGGERSRSPPGPPATAPRRRPRRGRWRLRELHTRRAAGDGSERTGRCAGGRHLRPGIPADGRAPGRAFGSTASPPRRLPGHDGNRFHRPAGGGGPPAPSRPRSCAV